MKTDTFKNFKKGAIDSLPIAAGYFGVSFSFGIMAVGAGLDAFTATVMSLTNLTSAGQFAGIMMIAEGAGYIELLLSQIIINLRYALMSLSLSQKLDKDFGVGQRAVAGFVITDEIFAVASGYPGKVRFEYLVGLGLPPIAGWTLGTLTGALAGSLLPASIVSALSVALYAMFIAIVLPPARDNKNVAIVALIALCASCIVRYAPLLNSLSSGTSIIICTLVAAAIGAALFPVDPDEGNSEAAGENDNVTDRGGAA